MTDTTTAGQRTERETIIRSLLLAGEPRHALNKAVDAAKAAIRDLHKQDPRAAAHLYAVLAATFTALAETASAHQAPADCNGTGTALLAAYEASRQASQPAGHPLARARG